MDVAADEAEGLAAVGAPGQPDAQGVDLLVVLRIKINVGEVPADPGEDQQVVLVRPPPGRAAVVRPVDLGGGSVAAVEVVDQDVGLGGVPRRDGQADPPRPLARRQAPGQAPPGRPAVLALVDAARRAGDVGIALPGRGVDDVRIGGGDDDVVGPGPLVDEEDVVPGPAPVPGPIDAPVGIGRPIVAVNGDEGRFGIARMDVDLPDMVGVLEPQMAPGQAAVVRTEDARAGHREIARLLQVDARPQPDRFRPRGGQGHVADPEDRLVLENGPPGQAAVRRLPEVARAEGGVERPRPRRVALDAGRAGAVHDRAQGDPLQPEGRVPPELEVAVPGPEERIEGLLVPRARMAEGQEAPQDGEEEKERDSGDDAASDHGCPPQRVLAVRPNLSLSRALCRGVFADRPAGWTNCAWAAPWRCLQRNSSTRAGSL